MTVDISKFQFGGNKTAQTTDSKDLPKAQFWLNVGYVAEGAGKEGEDVFVSLPTGIPLDTQEHLKISGKNEHWKAFQSARNGLLDQLIAAAQSLQPGEETLVNIQVQVRRVSDESEQVIDPANNPFARQVNLLG